MRIPLGHAKNLHAFFEVDRSSVNGYFGECTTHNYINCHPKRFWSGKVFDIL